MPMCSGTRRGADAARPPRPAPLSSSLQPCRFGPPRVRSEPAPDAGRYRCAGYWTTCWKVGRLTQGMEGTVPTPMALYWMSSSSGLHLLASLCPDPASAPPVSLAREQVQLVGSLLP